MVDIDILMEIWKNRVKKRDFVLKWLSRVGSEVGPTKGFCEGDTRNRWCDGQMCPDVDKELWRLGPDGSGVFWRWTSVSRCGQGTMAPWARRLGFVLACYAPIRRRRSYTRALGNGPRNFEPWSSDVDDTCAGTPSPNYHTTGTGRRFSSRQI
ncbi:hypothetical protein TNCV_1284111 [Trichonephila clavipes]|uniref:Uncharacterized protein n=1 Tax=Trichonephila clavipes TaxID=2585209 RepID=A0A8X6SP81_TRICX|nr:hypothetical protein TNCV_1284111 [Trichonephila clavipes]